MIDKNEVYNKIISLLDSNQVEYKLFEHEIALTYEDLARVQAQAGFIGTEGKCMVLKADDKFLVYVTIQGKKIDLEKLKSELGIKKVRLATASELMENFGAEPGCAYPFGFGDEVPLYVNPIVFEQEWLLFSPLFPSKTVQAKGAGLKNLFLRLPNFAGSTVFDLA